MTRLAKRRVACAVCRTARNTALLPPWVSMFVLEGGLSTLVLLKQHLILCHHVLHSFAICPLRIHLCHNARRITIIHIPPPLARTAAASSSTLSQSPSSIEFQSLDDLVFLAPVITRSKTKTQRDTVIFNLASQLVQIYTYGGLLVLMAVGLGESSTCQNRKQGRRIADWWWDYYHY
jgi:hypothetical protein